MTLGVTVGAAGQVVSELVAVVAEVPAEFVEEIRK